MRPIILVLLMLLLGCGDTQMVVANTITSPADLTNISLVQSIVGTNDLVISVKDQSGSDLSATSPVNASFKNTSGGYDSLKIETALSLTIGDGAKLGLPNGELSYIYIYLINHAGVVEMAATSVRINDNSVRNTLVSDGTADDKELYSNVARTSVPIRLVGALKIRRNGSGFWEPAIDVMIAPLKIRREVNCILKRVASVWQCLDTAGHKSENVLSVVNGSSYATINFTFTATKILTFLVTPDETYAINGVNAGASVGYDKATIRFGQVIKGTPQQISSIQADITGANFFVHGIFEE